MWKEFLRKERAKGKSLITITYEGLHVTGNPLEDYKGSGKGSPDRSHLHVHHVGCVIVVRHRARSENSGYSLAVDGRPRVIAAAINGLRRNHVTKSRRFILPRRMHARA